MARVAFWARAKAVGIALVWIVLFVAVGTAATFGLGVPVQLVSGAPAMWVPLSDSWQAVAGAGVGAAGFGLATWLVGHRLNRRSWAALGWGEPRLLGRRLAAGVALGGVAAAVAVLLAVIASGAALRAEADAGVSVRAAPLAAGLLLAALGEELLFRGYPLRRLADAVGPAVATALVGAVFAAAHLGNPNVTALGTVNVGLAALWLAAAFFSTGGMPLAWGLHVGWNAGLALGFETPVSGFTRDLPLVDYAAGRHGWVDGGAFGPEGGLAGTLVFAAGAAALLARGKRPRAPEMA